jgi:hypothetical protein
MDTILSEPIVLGLLWQQVARFSTFSNTDPRRLANSSGHVNR